MAAWKLAPALASGCTVVLKPAEQTPLSALRLGELIMEAGFPDGVVNIVPGYGETAGAALAAHDLVDKIAFTGSTEVGKLIVHAATGNLKKVSLELGGKSPNVVFKDADLDPRLRRGQRHFLQSRPVLLRRVAPVRRAASLRSRGRRRGGEGEEIKVGSGLDPATHMGPLVSEEQLQRVCNYLEIGMAEGAKAASGGRKIGGKGYFVEPTVLVDTKDYMKVVQEEIFGPVVAAIPFDNPEELLTRANDSIYGLAAGIWTHDISKAHRTAALLRAGTVWINCYNIFDAALPFGGYKQSGWGREMGKDVLNLYTQTKAVCDLMFSRGSICATTPEMSSTANSTGILSRASTTTVAVTTTTGLPPNPPANPKADAASICPNCSTELRGWRCKVVCKKCGFYLSCSDFY
jgi:phenylacetaldehyde dehydrogenase